MRISTMTEPASSAIGGVALAKLLAMVLGVPLAVAVVMIMTCPRSRREWTVALISTVIASICGGAGIVQWFSLQAWSATFEGAAAIAGLHFVCGLPAWVIVRAWFIWSESRKGVGLPELAKEFREGTGL